MNRNITIEVKQKWELKVRVLCGIKYKNKILLGHHHRNFIFYFIYSYI